MAPGEQPEEDGLQQLASGEPAADRLVFGREVERRIRAAMARLSPLERSAFVLRHFEQRSLQEIGATLGLDLGATKHSVFRAVRKMREALQPLLAAGGE